jgi:hypothetical protein
MDAYVSLAVASLSNLGMLMGKRYSDDVDSAHPLTNRQLFELKQHSDHYSAKMQTLLEEVHNRLPRLTTYAVEDWGQRNFGKAWGRSEIGK